jgi:hypothetical protein
VIRSARIWTSARQCLCLTLGVWGLASLALASCASGASDITAPDAGEDTGTPGASGVEAGGSTATDAGSSGTGAADAASSGEDVSSNNDDDANGEDDAATADDAFGEDAGAPDAEGSDDTGATNGNDSGGSVPCGGIPEWFEGTTATEVQNLGTKYTCIVEGWCSLTGAAAVAAYEPGTGSAWQQAWNDAGACSAGGDDDANP